MRIGRKLSSGLVLCLAVGLVLLVGCQAAPPPPKEIKDFTILNASKGGRPFYAPYYVAQELFDEAEGVNLKMEYSGGSTAATQQLVAGNGDMADAEVGGVMIAVGQGIANLRSVWQRTQFTKKWVVPKDRPPIAAWTKENIKGKKIGISEFGGGEVPPLRASLKNIGLTEGVDVELIPIGEGDPTSIAAIKAGRVDIIAVSPSDRARYGNAGVTWTDITPPDMKALPGNAFNVKAEDLEAKKALIIGAIRAYDKAMVFSYENMDAAQCIAKKYDPASWATDPKFARAFLEAFMYEVYMPPPGVLRGTFDVESWKRYQDFLMAGGGEADVTPKQAIDVSKIVYTGYLDEIRKYDVEAVKKQAREYKCPY